MKNKMLSKILVVLILSLLLNVTQPVLSFAAYYFKITYNSTTGEIQGNVYLDSFETDDEYSISLFTNETWSELEHTILGNINEGYTQNPISPYYYYSIDGEIDDNLAIEMLKSEVFRQTGDLKYVKNTAITPTNVSESMYNFEYFYGSLIYLDHIFYNDGTVDTKIMWVDIPVEGLKSYIVYLNDEEFTTENNEIDILKSPSYSKIKFSYSLLFDDDHVSQESYRHFLTVPTRLSPDAIGFNGYEPDTTLKKEENIITFITIGDEDNNYEVPVEEQYTILSLGGSSDLSSTQPFELNADEIEANDFELVEVNGENEGVIPIDSIDYISSNNISFKINRLLNSEVEYTLRLSNSSSGNEITLSSLKTNVQVELRVFDSNNYIVNQFIAPTVDIGDFIPPVEPQELSATAKDKELEVSWLANTEEDFKGYLVYLNGILLTPEPIPNTTYNFTNLINDTTYSVMVIAVDDTGNLSDPSIIHPKPVSSSSGGGGGGGTGGGGGGVFVPPLPPEEPNVEDPSIKVIDVDEIVVEDGKLAVELPKESTQVKLPAQVDSITSESVLQLNHDQLNVEIPGTLIEELRKMVPSDQLKDAEISFAFDKLTTEQVDEALRATENKLVNTNVKSAGEIYQFSLSITTKDGKVQKLTNFDQPIQLQLKIADGASPHLLGVYYISDDGQLEYVGGQIKDGYIVAEVSHFSKYAVLEYSKSFKDVPANHWASTAINSMVAKHIVTGISDTTFAPDRKVSRAEFASMLVKLLGLKSSGNNPFTDVKSDKWYASHVLAAAEAGIVQGRTPTTFAPDEKLTRQEMTVMLMKANELLTGTSIPEDHSNRFSDTNKIAKWALPSVNAASKLGFIQGKGSNRFAPRDTATRAEAVQMLSKLN